eukprot:900308-Prorocentrum_minimum.AAC.1
MPLTEMLLTIDPGPLEYRYPLFGWRAFDLSCPSSLIGRVRVEIPMPWERSRSLSSAAARPKCARRAKTPTPTRARLLDAD